MRLTRSFVAWDRDRRRARRLSEYTDRLVLRRRNDGKQPGPPDDDDDELEAMSLLAAELTDLEITPPSHFRDELAERLKASDQQLPPHSAMAALGERLLRTINGWGFMPAPIPAAVAGAVVLAVVAFFATGQSPVLSAAEVLARSDEALAAIVHPGEVLHRTWRVRLTTWERGDAAPVFREQLHDEWMDGADFDHVASKTVTRGRKRAWASRRVNGEIHTVGFVGADEGTGRPAALNIEPTRQEYLRAADTFPPEARRLLHIYLDRWIIYMSMASERRFNREILEGTFGGPMPRSVSVGHTTENGRPAYAVSAVDPSRVDFMWQSGRPPSVQLTRDYSVIYIAKDSYLTIKSERHIEYPTGRRTLEVRTLEGMRTYRSEELTDDPFEIDVPPGTQVNRQSALELLTGVLAVLQREQTGGR